jgi:hypothetical protein
MLEFFFEFFQTKNFDLHAEEVHFDVTYVGLGAERNDSEARSTFPLIFRASRSNGSISLLTTCARHRPTLFLGPPPPPPPPPHQRIHYWYGHHWTTPFLPLPLLLPGPPSTFGRRRSQFFFTTFYFSCTTDAALTRASAHL